MIGALQADATVGSASAVTYCIQHRLLAYVPELAGLAADALKIADMSDQVPSALNLYKPAFVPVLLVGLVSHFAVGLQHVRPAR